jgi:hypothetical protein
LTHPNLSFWSWSDQIVSGEIKGSKYYPRGVTSILWLEEAGAGGNDGPQMSMAIKGGFHGFSSC